MRRLFAFITMAFSIVFVLLFSTQVIIDNKVLSSEFGGGTEFVYQITQRQDKSDPLQKDVIEQEILDRFALTDAKNADIELMDTSNDDLKSFQLRVKVGANTSDELNSIDEILRKNGSLSFCTSADVCVKQDELLQKDNPVTTFYSDYKPFPAFMITDKSKWDNLLKQADEATIDGTQGKIFIWENKFTEDTYENAYDEDEPNLEMKSKIIATINKDNYNEEQNAIILQTKDENTPFNLTTARSFVAARNAKSYSFEIKALYSNKFAPTFGEKSLLFAMIGCLVSFLVIAIIVSAIYGVSGIIASISVLTSEYILMLSFSFLGFAFSPASIIGMLITMILGFFVSISYFERIKDELKKEKRNIDKSNREAYQKSFMTTFDSCIALGITAVISFGLAKGMIQTLAAVTMLGALFTFLVTNYLNKWLMYWFCSSEKVKNKTSIYGLTPKTFNIFKYKEKTTDENKKVNATIKPKKAALVCGSISLGFGAILLASTLSFGLSNKGVFNFDGNYNQSQYITMKFVIHEFDTNDTQKIFETKDTFNNYLINENNEYRDDEYGSVLPANYVNMTFNIDEVTIEGKQGFTKNIYVSYELEKKLDSTTYSNLGYVINGIDIRGDDKAILGQTTASSIMQDYETNNIFLVSFLSIVWTAIYIFIRFGISATVAHLATSGASLLFVTGLATLTRLPFNSFSGYAFVAIGLLLSFALIPIFNKNRELLRDRKITKSATRANRLEILMQSLNFYLPSAITYVCVTCLGFVVMLSFVGSNIVPLSILICLSSFVVVLLTIYMTTSIYLLIRTNLNFNAINEKREKRRLEKNKRPSRRQERIEKYKAQEAKKPHETIIVGINEFR